MNNKQKIIIPAIIFAIIAIGLLAYWFTSSKSVEQGAQLLSGRTLIVAPSSEGDAYASVIIVILKDGNEARVPITQGVEFKDDKAIEIKKLINADGAVSYEFSRYKND